jgi:hypothetical protein
MPPPQTNILLELNPDDDTYKNDHHIQSLKNWSRTYSISNEHLSDINDNFTGELIKTINLGIGMLGLFYYVYYIQ